MCRLTVSTVEMAPEVFLQCEGLSTVYYITFERTDVLPEMQPFSSA